MMNLLLNFRNSKIAEYYKEENHISKFSDKPYIFFILFFSTVFYFVDLIVSVLSLHKDQTPPHAELAMALCLHILKIPALCIYCFHRFQMKLLNHLFEGTFGILYAASAIVTWDIQQKTNMIRTLVIGMDIGWSFLFLLAVLSCWRLKITVFSILALFGLIKTVIEHGNIILVIFQSVFQVFLGGVLIYLIEKKQRINYMKKFLLERKEQTLNTILNNIPENIAILDLEGNLKHCNQYFETCFNVSSCRNIPSLFQKFYDIKPRERFNEPSTPQNLQRTKNKEMKPLVKRPFVRKLTTPAPEAVKQGGLFHLFPFVKSPKSSLASQNSSQTQPTKFEVRPSRSLESFASSSARHKSRTLSFSDLVQNVGQYQTLQEVIEFFRSNTNALRSYVNKKHNFFMFDGKFRDGKDKVKSFEIKISLATFDSDECLIIILRDTTHRDIIVTLEGNSAFKDSVLSSISHELKTPLNTNLNLLQMAIKDSTIPSDLKENFLFPAHQCGKLLQSGINDILDYSQLLANNFILQIKGKYLLRSVEKLRYLTEFQTKKKNVEFHISLSQKLTSKVWTDHRRLRQILINLLNNAIKFTSKGHIKVRIEPFEGNTQLIKFSVCDTGIGIDPHDLQRMTEVLRKNAINEKLTNKAAELGMGLLISNKLARYLGPQNDPISGVNISSTQGKGSVFWFVIENREKAASLLFSTAIAVPKKTKTGATSQSESPEMTTMQNCKHLFTSNPTQEEIRLPASPRKNSTTSLPKRMLADQDTNFYFTEILDPSGVADEEQQVEERLACMIKDDNLKMNINSIKLLKNEKFYRGSSRTSTLISRQQTSLIGATTLGGSPKSQLQQPKIYSHKSAELPQIVFNVNPRITDMPGDTEENFICQCPEILVVDDDMFNLFTMQTLVKSLGLEMSEATNGREAIDVVLKREEHKCCSGCQNFKIIFMDLSMPTMNGFDATIKLKELMATQVIPEIAIIACTAFVDQKKLDYCFEIGMEGKVSKPVTKTKLMEILNAFDVATPNE